MFFSTCSYVSTEFHNFAVKKKKIEFMVPYIEKVEEKKNLVPMLVHTPHICANVRYHPQQYHSP